MTEEFFRKNTCRLCLGSNLNLVLQLTPTPLANAFVDRDSVGVIQEEFPLDLYLCAECGHLQLLDVVRPDQLFLKYIYESGTSPVFVQHFKNYADYIVTHYEIPKNGFAVDIGSNDGTLLQLLKNLGLVVLGVDPARELSSRASAKGLETVTSFFNEEVAAKILKSKGFADVITANNVFAHADDLTGLVSGVRKLLAPDGVFIFEVSYLGDVIEKTLFDTIYHEHLSYHSVGPLIGFFEKNGLKLIHVETVDTHGGSLRGICQHESGNLDRDHTINKFLEWENENQLYSGCTFDNFASVIQSKKEDVRKYLSKLRDSGKTVAGYGAPAKATTLMYHFGIGPSDIHYIIDDSPLKQGLFSPGLHIPVCDKQILKSKSPDYLFILAWNFADSIISMSADYQKTGGKFIVPLPDFKLV